MSLIKLLFLFGRILWIVVSSACFFPDFAAFCRPRKNYESLTYIMNEPFNTQSELQKTQLNN